MLAWHGLELGYVERRQNRTQRQHARPAAGTARPRRRFDRVARVEKNRAALLHVGIDMLERFARGLGRARNDRPIDQRIKRKLIASRVESNRLACFQRGSLCEKEREPLQPRLADTIDLGVPRDDISKARLKRRFARRLPAGLRRGARSKQKRDRKEESRNGRRGRTRSRAHKLAHPAGEEENEQRIKRDQRQCGHEDWPAQVLRFAQSIGLRACIEGGYVERCQPVGWCKRVNGKKTLGRSVKARRMVECGAAGIGGWHRTRIRGRRSEHAKPVKDARGRQYLAFRALVRAAYFRRARTRK